tara:strand:+ start:1754 stop:2254 length:501 start_codon:yes stop_codon:yes gene_type:complete
MVDTKDIKIFMVDCDGCLTDGFLYYTEDGKYIKRFNAKDGIGLMQVKKSGIKTGIVTGDAQSSIADKRAKDLKLDFCKSGIKIKHKEVEKILNDFGFTWEQLAFFGDDLNDLETIKRAGVSFCPSDAHKIIKENVDWVCDFKGGHACVREACDIITNDNYFGDFSN